MKSAMHFVKSEEKSSQPCVPLICSAVCSLYYFLFCVVSVLLSPSPLPLNHLQSNSTHALLYQIQCNSIQFNSIFVSVPSSRSVPNAKFWMMQNRPKCFLRMELLNDLLQSYCFFLPNPPPGRSVNSSKFEL